MSNNNYSKLYQERVKIALSLMVMTDNNRKIIMMPSTLLLTLANKDILQFVYFEALKMLENVFS